MDSDHQLLAVVPFYRRRDQLERCLAALAAGSLSPRLFVHDNSVENLGFTRACNVGIREALAQGQTYVLLINQDCYVERETIASLVTFMEAHPRCAIAGVKQLLAQDPDVIVHGGCTEAFPEGRHITGNVSRGDCAVSARMPWVNGACCLIRLEAVVEIGLMDESYFLLCSDADYCFTARQRGWEIWFCAEAVALHEWGGISTGVETDFDLTLSCEDDRRRFRDKWLAGVDWALLSGPLRISACETDAKLKAARNLYETGDFLSAEIECRQLLNFDPSLMEARLVLGLSLLRAGWSARASKELAQVLGHSLGDGNIHFTLADALHGCGDLEGALGHYNKAAEFGVATASLYNNRGLAFAALGLLDAAQVDWRRALEIDPSNVFARSNLIDHGLPFQAEPLS